MLKEVQHSWDFTWLFYSALAVSFPIIIPSIQFGIVYRIWDEYNLHVDREECSCSCWDTVFKGSYESTVAGYKHIYFNVTPNTLIIWAITVIAVICLYEAAKRAIFALRTGNARNRMIILFLASIYPQTYTWWVYFNYYNDDYYKQYWHQLLFSCTEMVSTVLIVNLMDKSDSRVTPRKLLTIISIATFHVLASGWDQFAKNIFQQQGKLHQVIRDIGLMIPDLLPICLAWQELRVLGSTKPMSLLVRKKDVCFCAGAVAVLLVINFCSFVG